MRHQQIGLLNYLLGMGPDPRTSGVPANIASDPQYAQLLKMSQMPGLPGEAGKKGLAKLQAALPPSGQNPLQGMSIYGAQPQPQAPVYGPAGGGIGGTTGLAQPHLAEGGVVDYQKGGPVHGKGTSTSDSIPAKLSNGEGVLNAGAMQQPGMADALALLNHLGQQHHLAQAKAHMEAAAGGPPQAHMMPPGLQQVLQAHGIGPQHFAFGGTVGTITNPPSTGAAPMPTPAPASPTINVSSQPRPVTLGQPATSPSIDPMPPPLVGNGSTGASQGGGVQSPQQRLETLYGPLGITPSGLQNQATNAYSQFLNQPSPADRAANTTLPQLQQNLTGNQSTQGAINGLMGLQTGAGADVTGRLGQIGQGGGSQTGSMGLDQVLQSLGQGTSGGQDMLSRLANMFAGGQVGQVNGTGALDPTARAALSQLAQNNPGQGIIQALQPSFQNNLAAADQVGGRFGTSNALGRQQATNAFNQTAQQALQQGATQQMQAASSLGGLANDANAQNLQAAIASAGNQLGGLNSAVNAAGQIGNQQLGATGQSINAQQGLNQNTLSALGQLGGFNLAGQGQQAQNLGTAGQLGLGQGNLGNNAAGLIGNIAGQQGSQDLNTVNSAYGAGVNNTQQQNQGQQTTIQLINQLLNQAQGASIGGPTVSTPGLGTQEASGIAGMLPFLSQLLGKSGSPSGTPVSGGNAGYYG